MMVRLKKEKPSFIKWVLSLWSPEDIKINEPRKSGTYFREVVR